MQGSYWYLQSSSFRHCTCVKKNSEHEWRQSWGRVYQMRVSALQSSTKCTSFNIKHLKYSLSWFRNKQLLKCDCVCTQLSLRIAGSSKDEASKVTMYQHCPILYVLIISKWEETMPIQMSKAYSYYYVFIWIYLSNPIQHHSMDELKCKDTTNNVQRQDKSILYIETQGELNGTWYRDAFSNSLLKQEHSLWWLGRDQNVMRQVASPMKVCVKVKGCSLSNCPCPRNTPHWRRYGGVQRHNQSASRGSVQFQSTPPSPELEC